MFKLVTLLALLAIPSIAIADPIPANRRTDWSFTGVPGGIPNRTTICATFSPGAKASAINTALNACNNGVVFLNAGTYSAASLAGKIQVYKSNVTLRGAGADMTTLTGLEIVDLGNGGNVALNTAITAGATKGSTTFTVASAANLSVGTMIEVDRDNDRALVAQSAGRDVTQVNMITAVSGTNITVRNPFFYDFSTGAPKVKFYFSGITQRSGVEDMKFEHSGFSGGYNFLSQYCESCWLKGIESAHASGYHAVILGTLNMEVRDSYIHEGASGPNNSGLNFYGNYDYGANSSAKIENNIFNKDYPAIELNNSSSGLYIGYNYSFGSPSQSGTNMVTWTFDDGHAPFNIMNLYEGNIAEMWGADNYFGGDGYGTSLRNYWTGFNPNYGVWSEGVQLLRLAYNYNIVGNVLGSAAQGPIAYTGCTMYVTAHPGVYRLGYPNAGNCSTAPFDGYTPAGGYPDPKVQATLLRWGNYDYFNDATKFDSAEVPSGVAVPADHVIPNSYYYASEPAWWDGNIPWPPIGPDVTGGNGDTAGHVNKIPAQVCWEDSNLNGGGSFSAFGCYASNGPPPPPPPAAPSITSASTASGTVGTAFNYAITASNTPTSFGSTGLPSGLSGSASTGVISGTPTVAGTSNATVSATNASGTGSAPLTVTIAGSPPPPAAPSITSALTVTGTVGASFSYAITASNNPTSFGATGQLNGLAVDTDTGVISGTPPAAGTFHITLNATNAAGTGSASLTLTVAGVNSSIFLPPDVPAVVNVADTNSVELGTKFTVSRAGKITAIRFYKGSMDTGLHIGRLWSPTGTLLASATFYTETASGWQQATLSSPKTIAANTAYTVSYHTAGHYSQSAGYFPPPHVNGPLAATGSAYTYGSTYVYPATSNASNYWVDVVFQ